MDYAEECERAYQKTFDPWGSLPTHPRHRLHERLWSLAAAMVPDECRTIVEHGCGLGRLTWLLTTGMPNREVIGLDTAPTAIRRAQLMFPDCQFAVADVQTWKPESPIDLAVLAGPYHRVADRVGLLRHVRSYLVPGGYILITYMSPKRLVGDPVKGYPDYKDEIFREFRPVEYVERLAVDPENGQQGGWRLYLGQKPR